MSEKNGELERTDGESFEVGDKTGLVWNLLLAITLVIVSCNMHGNSEII